MFTGSADSSAICAMAMKRRASGDARRKPKPSVTATSGEPLGYVVAWYVTGPTVPCIGMSSWNESNVIVGDTPSGTRQPCGVCAGSGPA
jgi:hypothetical protein